MSRRYAVQLIADEKPVASVAWDDVPRTGDYVVMPTPPHYAAYGWGNQIIFYVKHVAWIMGGLTEDGCQQVMIEVEPRKRVG